MLISGVSATNATQPNASVMMSPVPCNTLQAPIAMGSTKDETIAPLATPPESNAIPVNSAGVKNVRTSAIVEKDRVKAFEQHVGERYLHRIGYAASFYRTSVEDGVVVEHFN